MAGLVHDFGRGVDGAATMLREAARLHVPVSQEAAESPLALLHAPVGAALLREAGMEDEDVLAAVAHHTVGRAGMSGLEALVYTADFCEPGRTHEGAAEVRALLAEDLWQAAYEATRRTLAYLVAGGRTVDPQTVVTWNDLVRRTRGVEAVDGQGNGGARAASV